MSDANESGTEGPLPPSDRRRKRIIVASAIGLAAIGWCVPAAAIGCAILFLAILALVCWPSPTQRALARSGDASRRDGVWPGRDMKAVVECFLDPALIVDRGLLLRYRNPACSVAFGNMALGDPISLRLRSPGLLAAVEEVVASNHPKRAKHEERRPIERHWQVEILPIPGYQGEPARFFLLVFRDQTAELRIERMRTDFVANASHELRTPLASLNGFIDTLQGPAREDAEARDRFLDIMREQAGRMSRLIDDLLSLSRIEMKRHVPISTTTDLRAILEKVRSQMAPLAREVGVEIDFAAPDAPVIVSGDEDELIQVFANLVENACKYGASGKRVEITIERGSERGARVIDATIRDFGDGIPEEHVPRLTERFYRVDTGQSRAKRGTGLGLSITRNILLRHRSRLVIQSKLGEGSSFTARFPEPSDKQSDERNIEAFSTL